MPNANSSWKALPHRPIEKLAENLWRVEGDIEKMPLKRVMTIAKRLDGDLVVHSAVALAPEAMAELDAWGKVRYIIVPNGWHRIDAKRFLERYPEARVYCPQGARPRAEQVVPVHGTYADFPIDATVSLTPLDGVGNQEGVMLVRSQDGVSVVFNDALFNMPHLPGFTGFVLRHITQSSGGLRVTRIAKLMLIKDRRAFRSHIERLAATADLRRVIVSHHEMVSTDAAAALRAAVAAL